MKILRTKKDTDEIKKKLVDKYKKATAGCKSCPCCGATKTIDSKEISYGTFADLHITKYNKAYRVYKCECGAIWKSKKYYNKYYDRKTDSTISLYFDALQYHKKN